MWEQSVSLVSVPAQVMLFRKMGLAVVSFTENDCVIAGAVEKEGWEAKALITLCMLT